MEIKKRRMKKIIYGALIIGVFLGCIPIWNSGLGLPSGYKTAYGLNGKHWTEIAHPFYFYEEVESYSSKTSATADTNWIPYYEKLIEDNKVNYNYNNE